MRALVALLCTVLLAAGCAFKKKPEPPPIPKEAEIRAKFSAEQTAKAFAALTDPGLRKAIEQHLVERGRAARSRNLRLAVERIQSGETMNLGRGLQLVRTFVLYHEYDERGFTTWLEGVETVGDSVRTAMRAPVGGNGKAFATIAAVDLNRVVLDLYEFDPTDQACCPTKRNQTMYTLTGFSLEPAR